MVAWVLRILVTAGLLGSAWVHYDLWASEGFSDIPAVGPLFLVNAIAGVVIATGVLAWHHWLPAFLTVGFGVVTLAAFVLSLRSGGFFGVHEDFSPGAGNWLPELWGVITEAVCVVAGGALLLVQSRSKQVAPV